jgi:replicative DNA helicase
LFNVENWRITPMEQESYRGRVHGNHSDCAAPDDPDAERAVLACVLLDPVRIAEVAAALELGDFASETNRTIYDAMLRLHAAAIPIDVTLLVGALRDTGRYNTVGGVTANTLIELYYLFPMVRNLDHYVNRVAEMARRPNTIEHSD